jgi:hypothetical protein
VVFALLGKKRERRNKNEKREGVEFYHFHGKKFRYIELVNFNNQLPLALPRVVEMVQKYYFF